MPGLFVSIQLPIITFTEDPNSSFDVSDVLFYRFSRIQALAKMFAGCNFCSVAVTLVLKWCHEALP